MKYIFFYYPKPYLSDCLVTLLTMDFQSCLFLASLSTPAVVWPPPRYIEMLSTYLILCLPLALVSPNLPSNQSLPSFSALNISPKNFTCLLRIICTCNLSTQLFSKAQHSSLSLSMVSSSIFYETTSRPPLASFSSPS